MQLSNIRKQIEDVFSRLITTSLAVKQFYLREMEVHGGGIQLGNLVNTIAFRDIPYKDVYREIEGSNSYHIKLLDGGLLVFQYSFNHDQVLQKHRLCYFPCFILPTVDEAPDLYQKDSLYGDIILNRLVRFPIRFDYDPSSHVSILHPSSHLTLGQYQNCRIPVEGPVTPNAFLMFILRNFYSCFYRSHKNFFDKKPHHISKKISLTDAEKGISHFINGR